MFIYSRTLMNFLRFLVSLKIYAKLLKFQGKYYLTSSHFSGIFILPLNKNSYYISKNYELFCTTKKKEPCKRRKKRLKIFIQIIRRIQNICAKMKIFVNHQTWSKKKLGRFRVNFSYQFKKKMFSVSFICNSLKIFSN